MYSIEGHVSVLSAFPTNGALFPSGPSLGSKTSRCQEYSREGRVMG
jgi:hypothetical protein